MTGPQCLRGPSADVRASEPVKGDWRFTCFVGERLNRPGFGSASFGRRSHTRQFPPEFRQRALRMLEEALPDHETEYAGIAHVSSNLGVATETLRKWKRRSEIGSGTRLGVTSDELAEVKRHKRENAELRRANEILKSASAFFAAELDRPTTVGQRVPGSFRGRGVYGSGRCMPCCAGRVSDRPRPNRSADARRRDPRREAVEEGVHHETRPGQATPGRSREASVHCRRPLPALGRGHHVYGGLVEVRDVAFVTDVYSRRIAGWNVAETMRADILPSAPSI